MAAKIIFLGLLALVAIQVGSIDFRIYILSLLSLCRIYVGVSSLESNTDRNYSDEKQNQLTGVTAETKQLLFRQVAYSTYDVRCEMFQTEYIQFIGISDYVVLQRKLTTKLYGRPKRNCSIYG
jgi:hypothetical protein